MVIETYKEFTNYILRLLSQGVKISGISMDKAFYVKISNSVSFIKEPKTIMDIQICILNKMSYHDWDDFKIHVRSRC